MRGSRGRSGALQARLAARAPCTPDAAQSAERSFAAAALPAARARLERPAWRPWSAVGRRRCAAASAVPACRARPDGAAGAAAQLQAGRGAAAGGDWRCRLGGAAAPEHVKLGRGSQSGLLNFGGAAGGAAAPWRRRGTAAAGGAAETAGFAGGGAARGGGRAAAAAACCLLMMAFRASPGLEIWERSILVLISSASARAGRADSAGALRCAGGAEAGTHFFRFMVFERTGMALLLGDSDFRKYIENRLAFDFQLSCQIVDSNLAHPPFRPPDCSAKSSYQPHGVSFQVRAAASRQRARIRTYCFSSEGAGSSADSAALLPVFSSTAASAARFSRFEPLPAPLPPRR